MHWLTNGALFGARGKFFQQKFSCPFMLCPSHQPIADDKPPRMKFIQVISPRVHQYRCRHCGCLSNKSLDGPAVPVDMWAQHVNPRFVSKKHSYSLKKW